MESVTSLIDEHTTDKEDQNDFDRIHATDSIIYYKLNYALLLVFYLLCIVSVGTVLLICKWVTWLKCYLTHSQCSPEDATCVLVKSEVNGSKDVCEIKNVPIEVSGRMHILRVYHYRQKCFVFDRDRHVFMKTQYNCAKSFTDLHKQIEGLNSEERKILRVLFGFNSIEVPMRNSFHMFVDEILNPFYLFQTFAVISWFLVWYYIYAIVVVLMSVITAVRNFIETRNNLIKLRSMVKHTGKVMRVTSSGTELIDSTDLAPGDIIEIHDMELTCDVILLSGECIVNESLLTGESIPMIKTALPKTGDGVYAADLCASNTLFAGTEIVQVKEKGRKRALGLCVRTGFDTAKGKLILSIMYPRPSKFKYYRDSMRYIGLLFLIAFIGIIYSTVRWFYFGVPVYEIILRCMNHITVAIPPALPLALAVCTSFAMGRLHSSKIYTTSPTAVNTAGQVDAMCFDKTGTLTSETLGLNGIRPVTNSTFGSIVPASTVRDYFAQSHNESEIMMLFAIASAQSLVIINDQTVGDPLEAVLFKTTGSTLQETEDAQIVNGFTTTRFVTILQNLVEVKLAILKRFEFSSHHKRMSVVAQNTVSRQIFVFCKGSPEHIAKMSQKESVPPDFNHILKGYTHKGYRVIACAYKPLPETSQEHIEEMKREEAESELIFLGLIVMCNKMKPHSSEVIEGLKKAKIFNIMVTGDNVLTAVSVAKKCKIAGAEKRIFVGDMTEDKQIEWTDTENISSKLHNTTLIPVAYPHEDYEIAVTGPVFEELYMEHLTGGNNDSTFKRLLVQATIYARMTPDQKRVLSSELQNLDYHVGFCGDGANDAPALKTSHIGISLSQAEASIAAPFTSLKSSVSCVPTLIREGRAALATSFQMFMYMSFYSLIQFFAVVLLYDINSTFGDYQFLYGDLIIDLPVALLMARTAASVTLVEEKPLSTLLNIRVFVSLVFQLIVAVLVELGVLFYLRSQSWYELLIEFRTPEGTYINAPQNVVCYETTCLFIITAFQYWGAVISYSLSKPFKKPLYTNVFYVIYLGLLLASMIYICVIPDEYTKWLLQLETIPMSFRLQLMGIGLANILLVLCFERFVILGVGRHFISHLSPIRIGYYFKKFFGLKLSERDELLKHGNRKYNRLKMRIALDRASEPEV